MMFHYTVGGGDNKHKHFLRAIPEGDTKGAAKSTVVTVNNKVILKQKLATFIEVYFSRIC